MVVTFVGHDRILYMAVSKDLSGRQFGRLTVIERIDGPSVKVHWRCRCRCGNELITITHSLNAGLTQSCGCLQRERTAAASARHGHANRGRLSPEYHSWMNLRMRCTNQGHPGYSYYGGRGIRVCQRWANNFQNFLDDMGKKPFPTASIDRINNDGHYTPSNCRWATKRQQRLNQRPRRR